PGHRRRIEGRRPGLREPDRGLGGLPADRPATPAGRRARHGGHPRSGLREPQRRAGLLRLPRCDTRRCVGSMRRSWLGRALRGEIRWLWVGMHLAVIAGLLLSMGAAWVLEGYFTRGVA